MRGSRIFLFLVAGVISIQAASLVRADVIATDTASNYIAGGGWTPANNDQGSGTPGWGIAGYPSGWIFAPSYFGGTEQLSSMDASTAEWELEAGSNQAAFAQRYFPAISDAGGYITIDINADNVDSAGYVAVGFYDQTSQFSDALEFSLGVEPANQSNLNQPTGEDYFINAGSNDIDTGLSADGTVVNMYLAITSTGYSVVLKQGTDVVPFSIAAPSSEINNVQFIDFASMTPVYFNNITVVTLPPAAIAATPLLAMLAIGKLKRH